MFLFSSFPSKSIAGAWWNLHRKLVCQLPQNIKEEEELYHMIGNAYYKVVFIGLFSPHITTHI